MKYLDTYILAEIAEGNKKYFCYIEEDFILTDLTLAEFYWVLLRDTNPEVADYWFQKLRVYAVIISAEMMIEAMRFRRLHKQKDLSFFDCIGYVYACKNNIPFVTGDMQFEKMKNVEFRK